MAYLTVPAYLYGTTACTLSAAPAADLLTNTTAFWNFDDALNADIADATGRGNSLVRNMLPAVSTVDFQIGANGEGAQLVTGRVAKWGKWNRVLSSSEKSALAAGQGWPFTTTPSLSDAKAYYLLNEASGSTSYADATGRGNTLTKAGTNGTVRVAGPLGTDFATQFDGTNYLTRAATSDLQGGNASHTIAGWINMDALGTTQQLFWGQFDNHSRLGDAVYYHKDNASFQCDLGNDVDLYRNAVCVCDDRTPTVGVWYFILIEYNQVTNTLSCSQNNGTVSTIYPIQQPNRVVLGSGYGSQFQVNPTYSTTSGWDLVQSRGFCSIAGNADLKFGNNAKTVWGWVKFDDFTTAQTLAGFYDASDNHIDWCLQQSAGVFYIVIGDSAGNFNSAGVALADTSLHFFIAWYDKANARIRIMLDNTLANSAAVTVTPASNSLTFLVGAAHDGAGYAQQLKGTINRIGIANGIPNAADLTTLYNGGNGMAL